MDLLSRSGFGTFFYSIHVAIRRFGVFRILLTLVGVAIVISGLVGSTILVKRSQDLRQQASTSCHDVCHDVDLTHWEGCNTDQGSGSYCVSNDCGCHEVKQIVQQCSQECSYIPETPTQPTNGGGGGGGGGGGENSGGGQNNCTDEVLGLGGCCGNGVIEEKTRNSCTGSEGSRCSRSWDACKTSAPPANSAGGGEGGGGTGGGTGGGGGGGTSTGNGTTADNTCTAQPDCGGPNQGYCTCGADGKSDPKGKPTCQGGYEVLGGDCVPIGTKESVQGKSGDSGTHCQSDGDCGSGLICSGRVCSEKPKETTPPTSTERYGITDNICHLPGANCVGDEAWRNGSAAARGDVKALAKLKEMNATVFSTVTVDGGVVKVTPTTAATEQLKSQSLTPEVAKKLEPFQSQCSERLGLCPMIDPRDGTTVVGWVPSKVPLFGTFEDAKLARLNISIGDLSGANTPEYGSTAIRSATKEDFEKALAGQLTEENIKKWKAQAEKDQLKVGSDGQAIKDKDGNIFTVSGLLSKAENDRREALFVQQETAKAIAQDKVVDAFLTTNKDEIQNAIIECIQKNGKEKCTADYIKDVYKDVLKDISIDRLSLVVAGIKGQVDDIGKKHDTASALFTGSSQTLLDACKKENNNIPCGDEKLDAFRTSNMKFLSDGDQKKIVDQNLSAYYTLFDPESFETKVCVDSEKNCLEDRAALFALLTTSQKRSVEQKWLDYETTKKNAEARNKEIDQALVDLDKLIQDNIDKFTRMSVPNATKNQVLGNLIYGTFDTSKYPQLSDAEKKNLEDAYTRKMLASVRANTKPEDLAFAAPKIAELENALPPAPKGPGLQSLVKDENISLTENTQQTAQNLTWQQQLLLGGAKNIEWFNNLSYNQTIRNKAADYGYGADNALIGTGRLLNTVTAGGFGQYAATYADVNAENPNATYLNKAFNPKGMDATTMLIAKTATQFEPDKGAISAPLLNGVLNAPLFGPARWASALGLGAQALENVAATGDVSQIPKASAVNFMNVSGLEDVVDAGNRLFYQIGMTPEEADAYRNNVLLRAGDAVSVGMFAVAAGDMLGSTAGYADQIIGKTLVTGGKLTPQLAGSAVVKGLEKTIVEGTISQEGIKEAGGLFTSGFQGSQGNVLQKVSNGLKNVYVQGMPNASDAITILGDLHTMNPKDLNALLYDKKLIDWQGNATGKRFVAIGDYWGKNSQLDAVTAPGFDIAERLVTLKNQVAPGKITVLAGNWEPRAAAVFQAAAMGDEIALAELQRDFKSMATREVQYMIDNPEKTINIMENLDFVARLKQYRGGPIAYFQHTDTENLARYAFSSEDLLKLQALNPELYEKVTNAFNLKQGEYYATLTPEEVDVLAQATKELNMSPDAIVQNINTNTRNILVDTVKNPVSSDVTELGTLRTAMDAEHAFYKNDAAYSKAVQTYADMLGTDTIVHGHTPIQFLNDSKRTLGKNLITTENYYGYAQVNGVNLLNVDNQLSTNMRLDFETVLINKPTAASGWVQMVPENPIISPVPQKAINGFGVLYSRDVPTSVVKFLQSPISVTDVIDPSVLFPTNSGINTGVPISSFAN